MAPLLRCKHCTGSLFKDDDDSYTCYLCGRPEHKLPTIIPVARRRRRVKIDLNGEDWTRRAKERAEQEGDTARLIWSDKSHLFLAQLWDAATGDWQNEGLIRPREMGQALQRYAGGGFVLAFQDHDGLVQPIYLGEP